MRLAWLAMSCLGLGACFNPSSAQGTGTDAADSSTTAGDPGCPSGTAACPCYGNGTCDSGLECNGTVQLCIPIDCDPGAESCTCNAGVCLSGLECEGGVCVTPSASDTAGTDPVTTDSASTDPATTDPATTDPATTDPATTDPATTDPATTDPVTTDPATTDTDPTGATCDSDCTTCWQCEGESDIGSCLAEYAPCGAEPMCIDLYNCCASNPDGCADCCTMFDPTIVELFATAYSCINAYCVSCTPLSC